MLRKLRQFYYEFYGVLEKSHVKAHAAEAAFFLFISLVPFLLLLLTLIQFTPVTQLDVMAVVKQIFPSNINVLVVDLVEEVYGKSKTVIPITAVVAMWSASRGVLSIANGLNWIYGSDVERNYLFKRVRATIYTLFFVMAIVLSLIVLVFGNTISELIVRYIPILGYIVSLILRIRVLLATAVLMLVFMSAYHILPDTKTKLASQLPGAVFTAVGWLVCSFVFSIYVDVFNGLSNMYGSLATIILIMLWLYFCMYIMLLGARINVYIEEVLYV